MKFVRFWSSFSPFSGVQHDEIAFVGVDTWIGEIRQKLWLVVANMLRAELSTFDPHCGINMLAAELSTFVPHRGVGQGGFPVSCRATTGWRDCCLLICGCLCVRTRWLWLKMIDLMNYYSLNTMNFVHFWSSFSPFFWCPTRWNCVRWCWHMNWRNSEKIVTGCCKHVAGWVEQIRSSL